MSDFVKMLNEPKNTLGRTEEVVDIIKNNPAKINELFELYFQEDEWIRLRVSSALKRLWRHDGRLIEPFIERWVSEVALINQPSAQWTFAQMVDENKHLLSPDQQSRSTGHIKSYLVESTDWIVLNSSIQTLAALAKPDAQLKNWLIPQLERLQNCDKKSISRRAKKSLLSIKGL